MKLHTTTRKPDGTYLVEARGYGVLLVRKPVPGASPEWFAQPLWEVPSILNPESTYRGGFLSKAEALGTALELLDEKGVLITEAQAQAEQVARFLEVCDWTVSLSLVDTLEGQMVSLGANSPELPSSPAVGVSAAWVSKTAGRSRFGGGAIYMPGQEDRVFSSAQDWVNSLGNYITHNSEEKH